uniref:E3 ubiquitin-protein ligase E3D n=1 Tax=Rhabditophanes sp. KR3021 TaxID=114890 RepID=A0AC35UA15_9BILA
MPSVCEWSERSFMLEMKPKMELASLYVDCPPIVHKNDTDSQKSDNTQLEKITEVVRVGDHLLELTEEEVLDTNDRKDSGVSSCEPCSKYSAFIEDVALDPKSLSCFTWIDQHRLFMCRIKAVTDGQYLTPKSMARLERDILSFVDIDEFVDVFKSEEKYMLCNNCDTQIYASNSQTQIAVLPDDNYLENAASSLEFFCKTSCSGHHGESQQHYQEYEERIEKFLPAKNKIVLSSSFALFSKKDISPKYIIRSETDKNVIVCATCLEQLGRNESVYEDCFKFYHCAVSLTSKSMMAMSKEKINRPTNFLEFKFETFERYFAYLLLSRCESQSSLKVCIRSLDKRPYMLIWLLDPYVVMTSGNLQKNETDQDDKATHVKSFAALKVLYKIFDSESALNDPRANGGDASVCMIDIPIKACLTFIETLLLNSHVFPPSFRLVGQFCNSFFKLHNLKQ